MQYRFSNYILDTSRFSLFKDQQKVEIEPQVLRFLIYLIENRERVVGRDELLDKMFGQRVVTDNALTVRIRAVRRAVDDTGTERRVIATVQGHGYRFIAPVEATTGLKDPHLKSSAPANAEDHSILTRLTGQPSIAILPFSIFSGEDDDQTIAHGLTYDLITRVAYCRSLFVIARGSAFQFSSGNHDVREVGKKLGARYVCQGAIQTTSNRVRISIGLADTRTRQEIWAEQFDRPLGDILEMQEDIACTIAASLEYEVQRNEMRLAALLPATNLDAWSAFHRGVDHMYRFRISECDAAEACFRAAVDLESGLARPYAGLSFVNYERAYLNLDGNRKNWLQKAFDHAHRAVGTDPLDPMGHWVLGRAHLLARDLNAARRAATEATELNPSYATAQYLLGWVGMQLGERELCEERVTLARRLSPQDPLIYGMRGVLAINHALAGQTDKAVEGAKAALMHPDIHYQANAMCAAIFAVAGETELAAEQLRRVNAVNPKYSVDDFFSTYPFQQGSDIETIRKGLQEAQRIVS